MAWANVLGLYTTNEMITIELTEEEAMLFRAFREYQSQFTDIYDSGVFNVRSGKAVLHFNVDGVLDSVDIDVPLFRRGHKKVQHLYVDKCG